MNKDVQTPAALLPSGLFDLIGAEAEAETALVNAFLGHFRSCGYAQVQPPLMEFSASLLGSDENSELAKRSLRLSDPVSQQMMAIRADMTMQIARIAGSTLKDSPRPLRLCYAGQTLRSMPDTMRASRQFRQIGIELFGSDKPLADVEVMQTAIAALAAQGIENLTLDLSAPQLLPLLLKDAADEEALLQAINHKDIGQIEALGQPLIAQLCAITKPVDKALEELKSNNLPAKAEPILQEVDLVAAKLNERLGHAVNITFDPLEMRGFGYHSGISFAIYTPGKPQELGRGGRYISPYGEPATGFTLYAEDILSLVSVPKAVPSLRLPAHCDEATAAQWRAKGYRTCYALGDDAPACDFNLNDDLTEAMKAK